MASTGKAAIQAPKAKKQRVNKATTHSSSGPSNRVIEVEFSINLANPLPLPTGLTQKDVIDTMRNTLDKMHSDSGRTDCYACGAVGLRKSDLVHIAPLRPQTRRHRRAVCFECLQCLNDDEPWYWCRDCEPDGSEKATFVPIQQLTEANDPNGHEAFQDMIHEQMADGSWKRVPFFRGVTSKTAQTMFKQMSNRSWTQFQLTNKSWWAQTGRELTYRNLAEKIAADHPLEADVDEASTDRNLTKKQIRNRLYGDCTTFAEVMANAILQGPKKHRATAAFRNFNRNLEGTAVDIDFQFEILEAVFCPARFMEYLDVVAKGVNYHFMCRIQSCRCFMPSDCWVQAYTRHGTRDRPNQHRFMCPFCRCVYRHSDDITTNGWDALPWVRAQKILCLQDINMQADRPSMILPPKTSHFDQSGPDLNRSSAFRAQDWQFYLCKWEDHLTGVLVDDLKAIWSEVSTACSRTTDVREIFATVLDISKEMRQQPYFTNHVVPKETIDHVDGQREYNQKWTYDLLPVDPKTQERIVPAMQYLYTPTTDILSQKDQCRMWAYASYAIEFALRVEQANQKSSSSSARPA